MNKILNATPRVNSIIAKKSPPFDPSGLNNHGASPRQRELSVCSLSHRFVLHGSRSSVSSFSLAGRLTHCDPSTARWSLQHGRWESLPKICFQSQMSMWMKLLVETSHNSCNLPHRKKKKKKKNLGRLVLFLFKNEAFLRKSDDHDDDDDDDADSLLICDFIFRLLSVQMSSLCA